MSDGQAGWRRAASQAGVFLLSVMVLAWPAIDNGYPLVMIDTARHMGLDLIHPISPLGYNFWLYPLHAWNLPWLIVAIQAALAVGMIWLAASLVVGNSAGGKRAGLAPTPIVLIAPLAALTYLPFSTSTLLPDYFAAIGVLAIALTPLCESPKLRLALAGLIFCGATTHYSHAPLYAATLATCAAVTWRLDRQRLQLRRFAAPGLAIVAAVGILTAANWKFFDRASYSVAGPVFALARLQDDGPATQYLRNQCPSDALELCAQLERLPMRHSEFLWGPDSPLQQLGGFEALSVEAAQVVRETALERPGEIIHAVAGNALRQLWTCIYFPAESSTAAPFFWEIAARTPAFEKGVQNSKQQHSRLRRPWLANVQRGTLVVCAVLLLPLCVACARGRAVEGAVLALTLTAAVGFNAVITGGLSAVDARYGARMIWLLPLATGILAVVWHRRRRPLG